MRAHRQHAFAATAALALVCWTVGSAHAVTITTTGVFQNTVGGTNINTSAVSNSQKPGGWGAGTTFLNWGNPAYSNDVPDDQSGYAYTPVTNLNIGTPANGAQFVIGDFFHRNNPIDGGGGIDKTELKVNVTINGGVPNPVTQQLLFKLDHFETPNYPFGSCAAGGNEPCPDRVSFDGSGYGSQNPITINGEDYYVRITGFLVNGTEVEKWLTLENQLNAAVLKAEFTKVPPPPVPLPAALPMFLSALAGLGLVSRRKA